MLAARSGKNKKRPKVSNLTTKEKGVGKGDKSGKKGNPVQLGARLWLAEEPVKVKVTFSYCVTDSQTTTKF